MIVRCSEQDSCERSSFSLDLCRIVALDLVIADILCTCLRKQRQDGQDGPRVILCSVTLRPLGTVHWGHSSTMVQLSCLAAIKESKVREAW